MSIEILEYVRKELLAHGAVRSTPEFCRSWLARSDGYLRTLRYHRLQPSMEALAVCSHKLGYYAERLRTSEDDSHKAWAERFDRLSLLCEQAIAQQAKAKWMSPDRMGR